MYISFLGLLEQSTRPCLCLHMAFFLGSLLLCMFTWSSYKNSSHCTLPRWWKGLGKHVPLAGPFPRMYLR